jgi:hypothetical protein
MSARAAALLALVGLLLGSLAGCGRYGKPVRSAPEEAPQEHALGAEKR